MNALYATQGQALLWAIFTLAGALCALLSDVIRLLCAPFRADMRDSAAARKSAVPGQAEDEGASRPRYGSPLRTVPIHKNDNPQYIITYNHASGTLPADIGVQNDSGTDAPDARHISLADAAAGALSGAVSALIAAAACYIAANGRIRPYMLLAMGAGAFLYRATLGLLLHGVLRLFLRVFRTIYPHIAACRAVQRIFK